MPNSSPPKTWRDVLPIHPCADLFPPIPEAELKELAGDIEAHGLQTPVVVWNPSEDPDDEDRYLLLDGRSRLDALALLGLLHVDQHGVIHLNKSWNGKTWLAYETPFELLVRHRDGGDPYALALSLNLHRRHLTTEQKRDLIAKLVQAKPEASNLQIAKQVKADDKTVAKVRSELEARSEIPNVKIRTDTKGRKQPSAKPKKSSKPTSPAKTDPIGNSPVRHSEVPPRLLATVHFLINDISCKVREAEGKLSPHDRAQLFAKIRTLVDPDDIVAQAISLVEQMTVSQRQDFVGWLKTKGLIAAEHAALDEAATNPIPDDLSIPAFMQRRPS